jgi:hypothetical protein
MARKRHSRRGGIHIGRYVTLTGKILGTVVMAAPAIQAVTQDISAPQQIPRDVLRNYTGVDYTGQVGWDQGLLFGGVTALAGGYVIMKLFSFMGKHIR